MNTFDRLTTFSFDIFDLHLLTLKFSYKVLKYSKDKNCSDNQNERIPKKISETNEFFHCG